MRGLRRILILKSPPCSLIVLLMIIIIFSLSHQFSNSTTKQLVDSNPRLLKLLQHELGRKSLLLALRRASMSDNTVILTVVNEAWAKPDSILDLFLESFRIGKGTKRLLNHLLVIAEDTQAFHFCKSRHSHCFHWKNSQMKSNRKNVPSGTQGSLMISPSKLKLLQQVVDLGFHVVFTNADVMWLRNPLTELVSNTGMSISCELYPIDDETFGIEGDGGLFHVKADEITYEFIKNCYVNRVLYPDSEHQSLCKVLAKDNYHELVGMKVKYLNEVNFGRLCQSFDLSRIYTTQANCCDNIDSKIHDLKLVLDDWRNYTELSEQNDGFKLSSFSFRAPDKCIE